MKNMNINDMVEYIIFLQEHFIFGRGNGKRFVYKVINYTCYLIFIAKTNKLPRKLKKAYKKQIIANLRFLDIYIPYKEFKQRRIANNESNSNFKRVY